MSKRACLHAAPSKFNRKSNATPLPPGSRPGSGAAARRFHACEWRRLRPRTDGPVGVESEQEEDQRRPQRRDEEVADVTQRQCTADIADRRQRLAESLLRLLLLGRLVVFPGRVAARAQVGLTVRGRHGGDPCAPPSSAVRVYTGAGWVWRASPAAAAAAARVRAQDFLSELPTNSTNRRRSQRTQERREARATARAVENKR